MKGDIFMSVFAASDFHGNKEAWEKLKKVLRPDDVCIILGDSCDRGKFGIEILKEIMDDPRFLYFIGNHDDWIPRHFRPDLVHNTERTSQWAKNCWLINTGPSYQDWINLQANDPDTFNRLVDWLAECHMFMTVDCDGTICRLAHARYPQALDTHSLSMSWKEMEAYDPDELFKTFWERYEDYDDTEKFTTPNTISLIGHNHVYDDEAEVAKGMLYNLDSGLGYGYDDVRLFCLNDKKLYHIRTGNETLPTSANNIRVIRPLKLHDLITGDGKKVLDPDKALLNFNPNQPASYHVCGFCSSFRANIQTERITRVSVVGEMLIIYTAAKQVYQLIIE